MTLSNKLRNTACWLRQLATHEPEPECKASHIECADECEEAANQLCRADARIAELERECGALREFALEIMEYWPHGDVDGCDLEIAAFKNGLIAPKNPKPTEPCGEVCACSGYPSPEEWAEGINCYVRTPLLKGNADAARAGNGESGDVG